MSAWPCPSTLLPHGPEARCIDSILEFDSAGLLVAGLRVHAGLALYDAARGGIPAWGAIEIMAQAAGLHLGLAADGEPCAVQGYLLGVRRFRARCEILPGGADLRVEAGCRATGPDGIARFDCRILGGGEEMASALLTLWRAPGE